jgi:predicted secreted hydrolase
MRKLTQKIIILSLIIFSLVGITSFIYILEYKPRDSTPKSGLNPPGIFSVDISDKEGYAIADGSKNLSFPEDQGPHPDYQTEWWYYTGNMNTSDGRHFGYQLTFFRRALIPESQLPTRDSNWATNQVYMAHFALTDVQGDQFHNFERFSRGAVGLSGAQALPFRVWLYDWQVEQLDAGKYSLQASSKDISISLILTDLKGPVLQGNKGYSQKGPEPGNASYYISQTRLETTGRVDIGQQEFSVTGASWMDHEFSSSALSSDQVGWDWFSIQLDYEYQGITKPVEIMVYQIRKADGSIDAYSSGTLINPDNSTISFMNSDFQVQPQNSWRSPRSGGVYPSGWVIKIPDEELSLDIQPYLKDQELNLSFDYWEGAVKIDGTWGGQQISGNGYVELTGYSGSMAGKF